MNEAMPTASIKYYGYHDVNTLPIKSGMTVKVPKGTKVQSCHPKKREFVTKREMTIRVNWINCGSDMSLSDYEHAVSRGSEKPGAIMFNSNRFHRDEIRMATSNPTIHWAGSGGYWNSVDINDIIPVP